MGWMSRRHPNGRKCLNCGTWSHKVEHVGYEYCSLKCAVLYRLSQAPNEHGCLLWTGPVNHKGYGSIYHYKTAHRAAWTAFVGPVEASAHVLHRCSAFYERGDLTNRRCANYQHLYLGDNAQNMRDMAEQNRCNPTHGVPVQHSAEDIATSRLIFQRKGGKHPKSHLTEDDIRAIRVAVGKQCDIARQYGVDKCTISHIKLRRTWKHVPDEAVVSESDALVEQTVYSKLTIENVRFIRSSSLSNVQLAELLGVSRPTISEIRHFRTWKGIS